MTEIRVIPEGVSGLVKKPKTKTASKRPPRPTKRQWASMTKEEKEKVKKAAKAYADSRTKTFISNATDYFGAASKRAKKMLNDNARENKRLGPKQIRKLVRDSLFRSNPHLSIEELEKLVDQNLPIVARAYEAAPIRELSEEEQTIRDARIAERRRVVRANRQRRKVDQPMSKADEAWVATGRR